VGHIIWYGALTGTYMRAMKWWHCRWPWVAPNHPFS